MVVCQIIQGVFGYELQKKYAVIHKAQANLLITQLSGFTQIRRNGLSKGVVRCLSSLLPLASAQGIYGVIKQDRWLTIDQDFIFRRALML